MVYAYDRAIPLPVKDLYDTLIMSMAIGAAKDMYDRGLKQIEDFYNKYGDFISPIQKDMDWYALNVTGKARDVINNLYANGIDPLRSAEGRAAVAQIIRSMPIGDIAKVRLSAETAKEYLKSIDDDTNPEFEKFLGRDLSTWSTLGDAVNGVKANGVWGASKASKYKDLNQYTSHIFDNIKDSYIGTDKNHYDWYGVTEGMLAESLTPDKLGGLLNTDLGRFHYQNAIKDLAAQGITNPTEADIMNKFRQNVLAANHERVHQDKRLNELWKMQQENAARRSAGRSDYENPLQYSILERMKRGAATGILGKQMTDYTAISLKDVVKAQRKFGSEASKKLNNMSNSPQGWKMFRDKYMTQHNSKEEVLALLARQGFQLTDEADGVIITKSDAHRIKSLAEVVQSTAGFRGEKMSRNRVMNLSKQLNDAKVIGYKFVPSGGDYGAFRKSDRFEHDFNGTLYKITTETDDKGNPYYKYTPIKQGNSTEFFLDPHLKSVKNAAGSGSLNTPLKDVLFVDTYDTSFQDATYADLKTTHATYKDTDYEVNAIPTEMPGYGQFKKTTSD